MNITRLCIRSGKYIHKDFPFLLRFLSSGNEKEQHNAALGRNPTPIFLSSEVQTLLKQLTDINMQRVFQQRKEQKRLKAPTYHFMTAEEVEEAVKNAEGQAEQRLQMPPVLLPRQPIDCVLAKDTVLTGYSASKFVFTDISHGKSDRNRLIVIRDPDGTLRKASWEERDRINQCYFPLPGRSWKTPKMFESEYLEPLLNQARYEFILDRACLQFEPDDPLYLSVTYKVYDHIDEHRAYEALRSTRHFGPLAFYLAWHNKVDNMILECLQNERVDNAARMIQLLYTIHPSLDKKSNVNCNTPFEYIKAYAESNSSKQGSIELILQSLQEKADQRKHLSDGLEEAHGSH